VLLLVVFIAMLLLSTDFSDDIMKIDQAPGSPFKRPEHSAVLQCHHSDSSYAYMYWYQQTSPGALELIGYFQNTAESPEMKFKERFNLTGHAK
ncbi:UNVERIFIED_CONTAM: hypothetical protein FKN15_071837, partial [Acipenser sinensis]